MDSNDEILMVWIPYRLQSVGTFLTAWEWSYEWDSPKSLEILIDGKPLIRGNSNAIVNPMIEAGIIHARALLEFLGLCVKDGKLSQVKNRRSDDIFIEQFIVAGQPLEMVSPEHAISTYKGPAADAEKALVAIFDIANKQLAHMTKGFAPGLYTSDHIDIACRGIPALINNNLYIKLGMQLPVP